MLAELKPLKTVTESNTANCYPGMNDDLLIFESITDNQSPISDEDNICQIYSPALSIHSSPPVVSMQMEPETEDEAKNWINSIHKDDTNLPSIKTSPALLKTAPPDCLVLLHIVSAGKQGAELGSDEAPVVMISAKVLDIKTNDIFGSEFQVRVKPQNCLFDQSKNCKHDFTKMTNDSVSEEHVEKFEDQTTAMHALKEVSMECQQFTGLTNELLANALNLSEALQELDNWIMGLGLYYVGDCNERMPENWSECLVDDASEEFESSNQTSVAANLVNKSSSKNSQKKRFEIVVDGVLGLRLVLHQNISISVTRAISLYPYIYRYIDLKKQFSSFYPNIQSSYSLPDMMYELGLPNSEFPTGYIPEVAIWSNLNSDESLPEISVHNIQTVNVETTEASAQKCTPDELQKHSKLTQNSSVIENKVIGYWPMKFCQNMAKLCSKMISDGVQWNLYESVNPFYQPAIIKMTEKIGDDVVIRARGLPWQSTDSDIQYFFRGLNIAPGGIALVLSKLGRRNGEAVIRFVNKEHRDLALRKHKHHMNQRYIELYVAHAIDFFISAGCDTEAAENFLKNISNPSQILIRMRGLPYSVSSDQILEFFANEKCEVHLGAEGVLFVKRQDGRATGDAFVLFSNNHDAKLALKSHRKHIGNRYIELFRSTPAEVNQVMNLAMNRGIQSQSSFQFEVESAYQTSVMETCQTVDNMVSQGLLLPNQNLFSPALPQIQFPLFFQSPFVSPVTTSVPIIPNTQSCNSILQLLDYQNIPPAIQPQDIHLLGNRQPQNFIRIKGMPLEAKVNDILNFLGFYWQFVMLHGIHLVYNNVSEPSGEAIIEFVSELAANVVLLAKQGHAFMTVEGSQSQVQLVLTSQYETDDFISIPGTQPSVNWPTQQIPCLYPNGLNAPMLMGLHFPIGVQQAMPCKPLSCLQPMPLELSASLPIPSSFSSSAFSNQPQTLEISSDH